MRLEARSGDKNIGLLGGELTTTTRKARRANRYFDSLRRSCLLLVPTYAQLQHSLQARRNRKVEFSKSEHGDSAACQDVTLLVNKRQCLFLATVISSVGEGPGTARLARVGQYTQRFWSQYLHARENLMTISFRLGAQADVRSCITALVFECSTIAMELSGALPLAACGSPGSKNPGCPCANLLRLGRAALLGLVEANHQPLLRRAIGEVDEGGCRILGQISHAGFHDGELLSFGHPSGALGFLINHAFDLMGRVGFRVLERAGDDALFAHGELQVHGGVSIRGLAIGRDGVNAERHPIFRGWLCSRLI